MMKIPYIPRQFVLSTTVAGMALSLAGVTNQSTQALMTSHVDLHVNQHLRFGAKGKEVKNLQVVLYNRQYYTKKIDGLYGPHTQQAVQSFQNDHQLNANGIADPETFKILYIEYQNNHNGKTTQTNSSHLLSLGSQGKQVIKIQRALKQLGMYNGQIDGIYGHKTQQAVITFQSDEQMKVDGIVGPTTSRQLFNTHHVTVKAKKLSATNFHTVDIIKDAKKYLGSPYKWGGITPNGFDCSGFVKFIFHKVGVNLPRTVNELWNYTLPANKLSVGQLVFFQTYKPGPSHAGIYIGNHLFIHAGSHGVKISSLQNSYWSNRFLGTKKIPNQ